MKTGYGRMVGRVGVVVMGVATLGFGGCAGDNAGLAESNRALTDANTRLTRENAGLRAEFERLQSDYQRMVAERDALVDVRGDKDSLIAEYDRRIRELDEALRNVGFGQLDPQTDMALRALAEANPGLVIYDPDRGMLRFTSDLTFGSGSDVVKESAKGSLQEVAKVLASAAGQQYDIRVVGHTDSQKIGKSRDRFPTNMHLSAYRAISVRNELVGFGVDPTRVEIAGWGPMRPLVPNSADGGTPRNRRVEIYVTKRIDAGDPNMTPTTRTNNDPTEPAGATPATPEPVEVVK